MTLLIDAALRAGLIVLAGLLAHGLLRGRSAALRHAVLAATLVAAAAVAPLSLIVPGWDTPVRLVHTSPRVADARSAAASTPFEIDRYGAAGSPAAVALATPAPAPTSGLALSQMVLMIWAMGCVAGLSVLAAGLAHLTRIERRATRIDGAQGRLAREIAISQGVRREVTLLVTDTTDVLATWGVRRPRILLPSHARDWSEDRLRIVLAHELAHIRRHDWLVQLFADALRCAYWFNPLLWIACARMRHESEQACDDTVLRGGVAADRYATHLIALARRCRRLRPALASAAPMARPSTLERRIVAMLNPGLNRDALTRRAIAFTSLLLVAVTIPAAAVRGAQTSPLPLTGTVYDSSGAVLPQTEIALLDEQQAPVQAGATDGAGRFVLDAVAPGKYVLQAAVPGFRQLRQEIELRQARDWQRAITLQVGTLQETISIRAPRPTAARPSAGAAAPTPVRVGGNIRAPMKLADVKPVYPAAMRDAGLEGRVPLEAILGRDGSVQSLRVVSATVHPDFAAAAIEAVRQWQYSPTLLNGAPVEVLVNVSIDFSLSDQ